MIRYLETQVIDLHFALAPLKFIEQSHQLHARGAAGFQIGQQVRKRQSRVDNIFNHNQIASFNRNVEILKNTHLSRSARRGAVAGDGHKLDSHSRVDRAQQICQEKAGALEHANQEWVPSGVVVSDLDAQLSYSI